MHKYDRRNFTWGAELEWGDVDRTLEIPPRLGRWDYSEVGVLNLREPHAGLACDPLGVSPPVGGEINTTPTRTWEGQVERILELKDFFARNGCPPTISNISGLHFHVHVPGLREDLAALKRLTRYTLDNQQHLSEAIYGFWKDPRMRGSRTATRRLSNRTLKMPVWMGENIINMAEDFEDFIRIQCCGKDGVSRGRPFRYHVNTYNLNRIDTIEFRGPGPTLDPVQIRDLLDLIGRYLESALEGGHSVQDILSERSWNLPQFEYNPAHYMAWETTRHPDSRGTKVRLFVPPSELES